MILAPTALAMSSAERNVLDRPPPQGPRLPHVLKACESITLLLVQKPGVVHGAKMPSAERNVALG